MENTDAVDFDVLADEYIRNVNKIIPAYQAMHDMINAYFESCLENDANILVVGAGGGAELQSLCRASTKWHLCGIDPSAEMIEKAHSVIQKQCISSRIELIKGYLSDLNGNRKFNAATAVLVMHFLKDDGSKLDFLKQIRRFLIKNSPLCIVDFCGNKQSKSFSEVLNAWKTNKINNGMDRETVESQQEDILSNLPFVSEQREYDLLREAGFVEINQFYKCFMFTGWIAKS